MTTLVLLPGMDGTGTLFAPLLREFSSPVLTPQVVSYPSDRPLGYAELASHVAAALPRRGDYVLLGESFSGPVAATLAGRRPPRLRGLILACSFVDSPLAAFSPLRYLTRLLPTPGPVLAPLGVLLMGRQSTPSLRQSLAAALSTVDPAVLRHRAAEALVANAGGSLAAAECPVLYLQAADDRVVPSRCADAVRRLCPRAEVVRLPGPHFLLQTQPAAAAACIERFVHRARSAARPARARTAPRS